MNKRGERVRIKNDDGTYTTVTRCWDEFDECAAKAGNAIRRIGEMVGFKRNAPKRPMATVPVTGGVLKRKQLEKGL